jgi:hypothetical protein
VDVEAEVDVEVEVEVEVVEVDVEIESLIFLFFLGSGTRISTPLELDMNKVPHPVKHIVTNTKNKTTNAVCLKFIKNSF